MTNPELVGDSFLIVGFGREGGSVYHYLKERHPTSRIGIADRNPSSLEREIPNDVELFSGAAYLEQAASFKTIIRSPGISIREIRNVVGEAVHLTSATNIFFAECPGTIIGITGTKGKSTTSALTASILSAKYPDVRLVGNIGTPMLEHLAGATAETKFVIELSSYQLEDLRRSPHIAILLHIVPEHLDYHEGFDNYRNAKLSIARHQRSEDLLIINASNEVLADYVASFLGRKIFFSEYSDMATSVRAHEGTIVINTSSGAEPIITVAELPIIGPGNLQNALAAITCGHTMGLSRQEIRRGIEAFKPLEHRLEFVTERFGVSFYNDSLSTIPEALAHALVALGERVETVIAGGFDRGVDMTPVGPALAASKVRHLILFPSTGEKIWASAVAAAPQREYTRFDVRSMDEAVQVAYNVTNPGKVCVMSPASSSFSVFRDYRERGERFKDAVRRLGPEGSRGVRCGEDTGSRVLG